MAWVTSIEMGLKGHIPLDVYDANGMLIRRAIYQFNDETGEVESFVLDRAGRHIIDHEKGEYRKRCEVYPAPLTWKTISNEVVANRKTQYWDREGK